MTDTLKFSANLKWLFTELPVEQRYDAAAAAGFKAAEFAWPYEHSVLFFRELLANSGLQQVLINTPVGPAGSLKASGQACHPDSVTAFIADIEKAIEYASGLNCRTIHLQSGIRQPDVSDEAAYSTLVENVRTAAELAARDNIELVLEAMNPHDNPRFILHTQAQALSVIQDSGANNVKLLFDFYHTQRSEGDVTAKLRHFFPHIGHVQIADSPGRNEPGSGELNWNFIFDALVDVGYQGWVGCEYRPLTNTRDGLRWRTHFPRAHSPKHC